MSRLYDITGNILALQEMLESPVDDEQILKDTLEAVQGEYDEKIKSYCKVIRNIEADIQAIETEVNRLTEKKQVLKNNIDRLKKAMFDSMTATNITSVDAGIFKVSIQRNGGKLPVIVDEKLDVSKLPDNLVVVTRKPSLDSIRELLEAGKVVEGFKLGERGQSLRIK